MNKEDKKIYNRVYYLKKSEKLRRLEEENQQLKERVEYLERSNNRREETIINLRNEQQLDLYKNVLNEVKELIVDYLCTIDYCGAEYKELPELFEKLLDKVGDGNE